MTAWSGVPPCAKAGLLRRRGVLAACAAAAMLGPGPGAGAAGKRAEVAAAFGSPAPVKSMSGFLNSIQYPNAPAAMIAPLQPRLWRSNDLRQYGNIRGWGARFEQPLSDAWGYPLEGNWTPPYADFAKWEEFVRAAAHRSKDMTIWWDIWNEPDTRGSWLGSRQQFCETWVRAANALREVLGPGTMVGGPSTSSFQPGYIEALLGTCMSAGTAIDFLAWHELEPWSDIALVASNLRLARSRFLDGPRFARLGLREIHIHEFIGEVDQYRPAELLAFLYFLESGGADAASRSCWARNCENNSIDGVVDPATAQPRADWWVHRLYAKGTQRRVPSHSEQAHVVAIAQALPADGRNVQLLVGYYGHEGATAPEVDLRIRFENVSSVLNGASARLRACRVPDAGAAPVTTLQVADERRAPVVDDTLVFDLKALQMHEVYALSLDRAEA